MKYFEGNIYTNTIASSSSEVIAYLIGGLVYKKLGVHITFIAGFVIATAGGLLILFLSNSHKDLMPIFVIFAKFGISINFVLNYIATMSLFPTLFCATAFGIVNFFARLVSIPAPVVAELSEPTPMILFCILTTIGAIVTPFIIVKQD